MSFNKQCILLTHVFIESHEEFKIDQTNFVVQHFRKNNPDAYIIVVGHGLKPDKLELYCDHVDWRSEIIRSEIGYGHPILVNAGIDHAIQKGFPYILKTRLDGINLIPNIFDWCLNHLDNMMYLTTQITSKDEMILCDLFNFSKTAIMKECWNPKVWNQTKSGLYFHAENFFNLCLENKWEDALTKNCKIKDIFTLKWIDFRNNWGLLYNKKEQLLNNHLDDYIKYLWGSTEGWLVWNSEGKLIQSNTWNINSLLTEK